MPGAGGPAHAVTGDGSTQPRTPLCLILHGLITDPPACLHRECLITVSFISSAAFVTGETLPAAFATQQRLGTLRWQVRARSRSLPGEALLKSVHTEGRGGWLAA